MEFLLLGMRKPGVNYSPPAPGFEVV